VDDILEEIGQPRRRGEVQADNPQFSNGLDRFLRVDEPVSVDELALRSGRPAAECLADLTLLEVSGFVARTAGGGFVKLDGPARYIGKQTPASGKDQDT
jgi:predicted Rossmann fold nucleotide-binding protein DprA/Smf involved in DNA uptake